MKRILLVEPDFPIPSKSKNHKNFLPIGLLKIASMLRSEGYSVKLMRGVPRTIESTADVLEFNPDEVWITTLFTYWAKQVKDAVGSYRRLLPKSKIVVGGIYASLRPEDEVLAFTGADEVHQGVIPAAERLHPAYDLLNGNSNGPVDYQIIHSSRGCLRKCKFCGTWKIEPEFVPEMSIKGIVKSKKLVFYDNNFLMNPHVKEILGELAELKREKKIEWCESQSGFDGRLILKNPELADMIKDAGFRYPRIAWDWHYSDRENIKQQLDLLKKAGYASKDIFVFVLYNWDIPFDEMDKKRVQCWRWKVQISDCRFRPLDQLYDNYDPAKKRQTTADYYIHEKAGWNDDLVKKFRQNIRRQNICVREGLNFYSATMERKKIARKTIAELRRMKYAEAAKVLEDIWNPGRVTRVRRRT